jgi:hypothetical protein
MWAQIRMQTAPTSGAQTASTRPLCRSAYWATNPATTTAAVTAVQTTPTRTGEDIELLELVGDAG